MRRGLLAVAAAALALGGAGAAQAENKLPAGETSVFRDAELGRSSPAAKWEVTRVQKDCAFHVMSREGPSMAEMTRCEAAVSKLVRRGAAAAPAVLAALDDEKTEWGPRHRLYDVLARTADARLVEPLIRGMARIEHWWTDRGWPLPLGSSVFVVSRKT